MKKLFSYAPLFILFLNVNAFAQIESRAIDGSWRSVRMKLVKDEFRPYVVYFPETNETALRAIVKNGAIVFDRAVAGFYIPDKAYPLLFADEVRFNATSGLKIIKSDKYHIVLDVPVFNDDDVNSGKEVMYQLAFERDR